VSSESREVPEAWPEIDLLPRSASPAAPHRFLGEGEIVIADKSFADAEFEQHVRSLGGQLLRPDH
jgi:hypothetical protein